MTATDRVSSATEMIMGLPFSIHLRHPFDPGLARRCVDQVWSELRRYDQIFSTYRHDSDINRIDGGDLDIRDADPAVAEVLDLAEQATWCTHGAFDIYASGRLDPSGIVKGWAAERACRPLHDLKADFYCNAGGDVLIHTIGPGRTWRIGIEHPANPAALMTVLELASGAVATSGSAHRGAHILDPTGRPAAGVTQATVLGPTLTWTDILATAVVAEGHTHPDTRRWPPGYDIVLVNDDGHLAATPGAHAALAADLPAPPVRYRLTPVGTQTQPNPPVRPNLPPLESALQKL